MVTQTIQTVRHLPTSFIGKQANYHMGTILIAEDDTDNRELLTVVLEMWKYRVIEANDGREALRLAEKMRPDLILMDVKMPLLDGLDVTRQIRQSAEMGRTPIIFISGCAEPKSIAEANAAGASAYLVKPLNFDILQYTIAEHLKSVRDAV